MVRRAVVESQVLYMRSRIQGACAHEWTVHHNGQKTYKWTFPASSPTRQVLSFHPPAPPHVPGGAGRQPTLTSTPGRSPPSPSSSPFFLSSPSSAVAPTSQKSPSQEPSSILCIHLCDVTLFMLYMLGEQTCSCLYGVFMYVADEQDLWMYSMFTHFWSRFVWI